MRYAHLIPSAMLALALLGCDHGDTDGLEDALASGTTEAAESDAPQRNRDRGSQDAAPTEEAPEEVEEAAEDDGDTLVDDLTFLREEEKLARDVYLTLFDEWGVRVFQNIASSEQTHTDRVLEMLEARGGVDPVEDDTIGVFTNALLADLYDDLVSAGQESRVAALTVGATIEDLDINDIEEMIARADDPEAITMYEALACGSRNHMRAFAGQLSRQGATYEAQFITAEALAEILETPNERCGGQ